MVISTSPRGQCKCDISTKWNDAGTCTDCDPNCLTCSGSASNNCLTCATPMILNSTTKVCECPANQVKTSPSVCTNCDSTCATCNGILNTNCLSCKTPDVQNLVNGQCYCINTNQYMRSDGNCDFCSASC